jgi:predicted lipoprotein with Yx(FWY)xxD motif
MRRSLVICALAAAVLLGVAVAAAAGGSNRNPVVGMRATPLGSVLVAANGRTLYLFTGDSSKASSCYGSCAAVWPPLLAKGTVAAGSGLKGSLVGTVERKDGTLQVTYAGHPLYFFAHDGKAGQTKGQASRNFGGRWFVLSPAGIKVVAAHKLPGGTAVNPPQTTTNSTGGSYNK